MRRGATIRVLAVGDTTISDSAAGAAAVVVAPAAEVLSTVETFSTAKVLSTAGSSLIASLGYVDDSVADLLVRHFAHKYIHS